MNNEFPSVTDFLQYAHDNPEEISLLIRQEIDNQILFSLVGQFGIDYYNSLPEEKKEKFKLEFHEYILNCVHNSPSK